MEEQKIKCRACKELIWRDASTCPHCLSQQKKQTHKIVLARLKEFSAVTVIFSLIFAVMEFNRFVDSWLENSAYAERLAKTASMLIEAGDFTGADKLLTEAKSIYPASEEIGGIQKQLAMINIRKTKNAGNPKNIQILKDSLNSLYRNLGEENNNDAEVLAHIAWATFLLRDNGYSSVDINQYLDKSLTLNKNAVYANAYKGYWYLTVFQYQDDANVISKAELVKKAQQHFNVALKQNMNVEYVRQLQLSSLDDQYNLDSAAEYVKLILLLKLENNPYFNSNKKYIEGRLARHLFAAVNSDIKNDSAYIDKVFLSLNEKKVKVLLDIFNSNAENEKNAKMLEAKISEAQEDTILAVNNYIEVYKLVKSTAHGFRYRVPTMIKRICDKPDSSHAPDLKNRCDHFFTEILDPRHLR